MARRPEIADALRSAGLTVVEHDGWQQRGSADFEPAGVMLHHTASASGRDAPSVSICINGRPDLPGPLCQVVLSRSGVCHVIAAGRANHAGKGAWAGESGNAKWFGIEAENNGVGEPWPQQQFDAYVSAARVLADLSSRGLVCGHKEYATPKGRKIDPAGIDLDDFRARVARPQQEDDDMPTADEIAKALLASKIHTQDGQETTVAGLLQLTHKHAEAARENAGVGLEILRDNFGDKG